MYVMFLLSIMYQIQGVICLYKLVKNSCKLDCKKCSFSFRVINVWNFLSNGIVCCNTVKQFA